MRDVNLIKKENMIFELNIETYASFLVPVTFILAPYGIAGLSVTLFLNLVLVIWHFFNTKGLCFRSLPRYRPLMYYVAFTILLSINGLMVLVETNALINSMVIGLFSLVTYFIMWQNADFAKVVKYADIIGYICCAYVVYQFIMQVTGNAVPLGKLPFLEIQTGWIPEIWGFRFNSLFSEPSYFAVFLLPIFTIHFIQSNWKQALIFGVFIIMSSSSLGIIAMVCVISYYILVENLLGIKKIKLLFILIAAVVVAIVIILHTPSLENMITQTIRKIIDIFETDGVEDIRLSGHLQYFNVLHVKEQLFGVGIAQLSNYFSQAGYVLPNYSNSFVFTLINSGIIGLIILLLYIVSLFVESLNNRSIVFFIILILVMAVDPILMGYRFYWLVYFVYERSTKVGNENACIICNT